MTTLRLFNTLTKTKEDFVPIDPANVRMYVCGPTVYDYAHIGNARPVIVFDVLFRLLRHVYGEGHVTYVRNITDVDDKINARAAAEGISIRDLTEKTAQQYLDDVTALGCLPPSVAPRATDHIAGMIAMIEVLIRHGNAYVAEGHVLFDVSSKHDYGKLSRRTVDDMIAGARVEVAPYKKNPMDFVMWKPSDAAAPGWESPWGRGRPGWHIECSAMSAQYLGEHFDIHGGGIDLVFPHHENEIAQSEGAHHGRPFANVWMHNGFLEVEGAKMSKSLGNFVTIHELLTTPFFGNRKWKGDVLRFAMLQTQYRQPIDWTVDLLEQSEVRLNRWRTFAIDRTENRLNKYFFESVLNDLADDLNTPKAFATIDRFVKESEDPRDNYTVYKLMKLIGLKGPTSEALRAAKAAKKVLDQLVDFSTDDWHRITKNVLRNPLLKSGKPKAATQLVVNIAALKAVLSNVSILIEGAAELSVVREIIGHATIASRVEAMIEARNAARKEKDFAKSDRIRDELLAQGIVLKDGPTGTTWEVKR